LTRGGWLDRSQSRSGVFGCGLLLPVSSSVAKNLQECRKSIYTGIPGESRILHFLPDTTKQTAKDNQKEVNIQISTANRAVTLQRALATAKEQTDVGVKAQ